MAKKKRLSRKPRPATDASVVPPSPNSVQTRWGGHGVLIKDGFVPVVRSFLTLAASLKPHGLKPAEAMFILQLMVHKRDARAPFPGYKTVAKRMGVSTKYARKLAQALETKRLLRREVRTGTTNRFDLSPLFAALAQHAEAARASSKAAGQR